MNFLKAERLPTGLKAVVCVAALLVIPVAGRCALAPQLDMRLEKAGLSVLRVDGVDLLRDGAFTVKAVEMQKWDGTTYAADLTTVRVEADATSRSVTRAYSWGDIGCTYDISGNRLNLTMAVTNRSRDIICSLLLQPLVVEFPAPIQEFDQGFRKGHNCGSPAVVGVNYGSGTLVLADDEVGLPLYVGVAAGIDDKKPRAAYPILVGTARSSAFPTRWTDDPIINRPVYPGHADRFAVSLRFGRAGSTVDALASDVYRNFAAAYPVTLNWSDRRPIGALHVSSSAMGIEKNPRGWFMDRALDVTTEPGKAKFKQRLMDYADNCLRVLKDTGAQGMIVWDIEGQQYPHATSYLGDPRSLPPEMDPVADEFFSKFRDAGLRVGICIRPQRPVRAAYGDAVWQEEVADTAYNLEGKITYARKRWGCTMFYVDSNMRFDPYGKPNDGGAYQLLDAAIFQQITAKFPDVLLIPEHENAQYFAYTSPYNELRGGYVSTPAWVSRIYPKAFSIIAVPDGPVDERRAELVKAVKHGDILLFRGWFPDTYNAKVKSIYEEAGK